MSKLNKLMAVALAMVMALALAVPALATDPTGTLTISSAKNGETYNLYRIMDVTHQTGTENYNYTINSKYQGYFNSKVTTDSGTSKKYLGTIEIAGDRPTSEEIYKYISTDCKESNTSAFAMDIGTWIQTNNIETDAAKAVGNTTDDPEASEVQTVTVENLPYGYYLLMPTVAFTENGKGSVLFSLDTVTNTAAVSSKTTYPVPNKTVVNETSKTNIAAVGDELDFTIRAHIPEITDFSSYTFTFNDTMTDLTYKANSLTAYIRHSTGNVNLTVTPTWDVKNKKLTVALGDQILNAQKTGQSASPKVTYTGDEVVIKYKATVDQGAATTHYADNTVNITYSRDPKSNDTQTSKNDKTRTYTLNFVLNKTTDDGKPLPGSKWKLEIAEETTTTDPSTNEQVTTTNWVDLTSKYACLTDGTSSTFNMNGLTKGKYRLTETEAPAGYAKLSDPIIATVEGTIPSDTSATAIQNLSVVLNNNQGGKVVPGSHDLANNTLKMTVKNSTQSALPETGGAGLYIVAGVAIVALLGFGGTAMLKRKVNGGE